MAYTQINLNPENKRVGDCTVRAIAAGTGKSWEDIYAALALEGYLLHDMPTANYVWGSYLRRKGWQAAYPQQQPTAQQTAPIIWVQGEEGAKAYMVAAGNSVLLMDSENSTFYIKSTDASGMPQPLRVFDYSERTASQKQPTHTAQKPKEEYVTRQEFNALTARFDALTADKPLTRKKKEADNEQPSV